MVGCEVCGVTLCYFGCYCSIVMLCDMVGCDNKMGSLRHLAASLSNHIVLQLQLLCNKIYTRCRETLKTGFLGECIPPLIWKQLVIQKISSQRLRRCVSF